MHLLPLLIVVSVVQIPSRASVMCDVGYLNCSNCCRPVVYALDEHALLARTLHREGRIFRTPKFYLSEPHAGLVSRIASLFAWKDSAENNCKCSLSLLIFMVKYDIHFRMV